MKHLIRLFIPYISLMYPILAISYVHTFAHISILHKTMDAERYAQYNNTYIHILFMYTRGTGICIALETEKF